eukprot:CAMPEP_0198334686 /NCGR_PEP_ID=MMETSP1450-20131203/19793_1 /TAXON_ID=753684 ORGANISM="Madagascaria erythrocladiodes, Strain CCMP3234" /NCGR_SAMPLE_ID=MMETSP1450 /ASSEMBLY_ACC=CAM_ASM_001115 /LENGTH=33 /DNA_ID= /DNA_START= /DNA_END= /DNA_ORIENTATION=
MTTRRKSMCYELLGTGNPLGISAPTPTSSLGRP